ncbi:ATP-dependent DNA helicase RecG [Parabacteroides johnsonii]|jgi:ATP-dependent DNA helicase RecG|uniref:ATP-dependent DNA helicase RecG n=2 Tax=Parabacteroides johnsonii TaxID=387661 RepID=K5ZYB2_9BACT|nr:ATP-dependent DNA helicase RecG [Parabacteroides johnsonii]EKN16285.1 ATP-dependent DNA helicase RecG [Parabacteroides johnsonii CL02T12C29]MBX9111803.1 ATP-dependent DNA helicase RecG [Parabacteroides johnsonii]MCS3051856.1 ATP-dependent DNA helicase RecG [Parabacteroides johnsonii]
MLDLDKRSIMYLPGVGPKKAEILQKEAGISSYEDLLFYFPYKYIDRSRFYKVAEVTGDMPYIQLKGRILFFDTVGEGRTRRLIGKFTDGTGTIDLVWFKGINYVMDKIKTGVDYIVFGKPTEFGHIYNIPHPDIDTLDQADKVANGLTPFYNTSEKMKKSFLNSRAVQNLQYTLLSGLNWTLPETLPPAVLNRIRMMPFPEAIRNVHFPESVDKLRKAQLRLKFDELFFIQLNILRSSNLRKLKLKGIVFPSVGDYFNTFYKEYLPFELTNAQKRVVREIRADMGSGRQMNRLLQGDVGSGKTLVALLSMLLAVDNHCQACMMAPTEILATQHYATVMGFLKDMDIKVALLTGSTKKKERNKILPAIASGEIQIVIGTHALIEETVVFSSLGLAIIDEQHRFGVEQRSRLWTKNSIVPHVLVMTATPIPRTLAMTLYGDLDVSVIDELPPGRKPIQTVHRYDNKKAQLYDFLRKEIGQGRQVYVVYPLIEGSEKLDYKNLEEGFETFKEVFPEYKVCMVHGKMKAAEKEAEMQKFISGEAQILMATTVIEVGVNVPNASVMVIESAERFGLSQLHQLRGRVGRGAEQSYCVLVSSYKLSNETRKRLEIMVSSNNGFEIAEADLRLRGHGDLEGTRQSGEGIDLKIANLAADGQILQYARDIAQEVLNEDPDLLSEPNRILNERLKTLFAKKVNWGMIS